MKHLPLIAILLLSGCSAIAVKNGPGQWGAGVGFGKNNTVSGLTAANGDYQIGVSGLGSAVDEKLADDLTTMGEQLLTAAVRVKSETLAAAAMRQYRATHRLPTTQELETQMRDQDSRTKQP